MVELIRSNDLVHISWIEAVLESHGILCLVFDQHTSAMEGSISAIARRVMVDDSDLATARQILAEESDARS